MTLREGYAFGILGPGTGQEKGETAMNDLFSAEEAREYQKILEGLTPTYDWLLNSTENFLSVDAIAKGFGTRNENVNIWYDQGLLPGAIREPATNKLRIPRVTLIVFFGRLVMRSFQVA
jgi:hypothetical protein